MNWNKKIDLINVLVVAFMVLAAGVFMFYYNQQIVNECTSNPLVFASRQMEDRSGYEFYGVGYFRTEGQSPLILFNSTGSTLQNPS
tara:strand:+ start:79 stop:336 length:258 start_codon:yes stop_codon:yes gene_type:complete